MAQITINPDPAVANQQPVAETPAPTYTTTSGVGAAAINNLTWALGAVLIIAAIAVAIVYLSHNLGH